MDEWEARVGSAAREIERYLQTHPRAADSLEGIAFWWVSQQRLQGELAVVRAALIRLAASGVVSYASPVNGQQPVYRLSSRPLNN